MKKMLILFVLVLLFAWRAFCVTQPQSLGIVDVSLRSLTAAQVLVATSTAVGQLVYCSNCTAAGAVGTICVSTATTGLNPFVLSTGTVCK